MTDILRETSCGHSEQDAARELQGQRHPSDIREGKLKQDDDRSGC